MLCVTNDTLNDEQLTLICRVRNNRAEILDEFSAEITSTAMSAASALSPDLSKHFATTGDKRTKYIEYTLQHEVPPAKIALSWQVAVLKSLEQFNIQEASDRREMVTTRFRADYYSLVIT